MSQYFHIANNTKKEYLNDHHIGTYSNTVGIDFGSIMGAKFSSLHLLAMLIVSDVSYGDRPNPSFAGEWQGDSVGLYGDWADEAEYEKIQEEYTDITLRLLRELASQPFWKRYLESAK